MIGRKLLGAGAAALLAGACSPSDDQVKTELRTQMMQRCTTDIAPRAASLPDLDADRFCTCVTDKAIGERSVADLQQMFEDKTGTAAQGRQAGAECLAQQLPGGARAVPQAPAAAPANGASDPTP